MCALFVAIGTRGSRLVVTAEVVQCRAEDGLSLPLIAFVAIAALPGLGRALVAKLGQLANGV